MWRTAHILGVVVAVGVIAASSRIAQAHGPTRERIAKLTAAIARDPANPDLYVTRATVHREMGTTRSALADLDHALQLDTTRDDIRTARAVVLCDLDEFAAALTALDDVLARNAGDATAWSTRGYALAGLGRHAEAAAALDRAIALADPPRIEDYVLRARCLTAPGDIHIERAIAGIDEGLVRLGPVASLQVMAVELDRSRGSFDSALARVDAMGPLWDREESLLALRGDVLAEAGRTLEAQAAYTEALQTIEEREARGRVTAATRRLHDLLLQRLAGGSNP
jgi:tetratricopeptide (TPR) repeat protein